MSGAALLGEIGARIGAALAARPLFFLVLTGVLAAIALCCQYALERKGAPALIAGAVALGGAVLLCAGPP